MEQKRNPDLPPKRTPEELLGLITKNMGWVMFIITAVLYLIFIYIYIKGFTVEISPAQVGIFSLVSTIFGFVMKQMAVGIGRTKAKERTKLKALEEEYMNLLPQQREPDKELKSADYKISKDRWKKAGMAVITLLGSAGLLFSFTIPGVEDPQFLLLGIGTLTMNIGLSLLGFAKTYDSYYEHQVPYMVQEINKIKESIKEGEKHELFKTIKRTSEGEFRQIGEPGRDQSTSVTDGIDQVSGSGSGGFTTEAHESESRLCGSSEDTSSEPNEGSVESTDQK